MKIIYIAGAGRSGSTLLSTLLSQHSDVFNIGQFRDFFRSYLANERCSCLTCLHECALWSKVVSSCMSEPVSSQLREMQTLMQSFFKDALRITDWSARSSLLSLRDSHSAFLTKLGSFISAIKDEAHVGTLLDFSKSPELALAYSLVEGIDLRLINLVRDPRAVMTSWYKKKGFQAVRNQTRIWADRQKYLEQWSVLLGDSMLQVRYEDFTRTPQHALDTIFSWAGMGSRPGMFESSSRAKISWKGLHLYPPANETFLAERKTVTEIVEARDWDNSDYETIHNYVESRLMPQMEHYGYLPSKKHAPGKLDSRNVASSIPISEVSSAMKNFVFLVCSERSGSNLISSIMKCHSKVISPPPYHLFRDVGLNLHNIINPSHVGNDWEKLLAPFANRLREFGSDSTADAFIAWYKARPSLTFYDIASYVYTTLESSKETTTVFIKENNLHQTLFIILHYFPNAKFVFQVRDPRDYLVSALERKSSWLGNKFGSNLHAMEVWRDNQMAGLHAMAHLGPERVFLQRYEDLITHPASVIPALCKFLGLDFEKDMLEFHQSEEVTRLAKPGGPRENLAKPLISDNFGKFREKLSKDQILMVEAYLGDLMTRFGYSREYPQDEISLNTIFMPQLSEVLERYVNGERGTFYEDGQAHHINIKTLSLPYKKTAIT